MDPSVRWDDDNERNFYRGDKITQQKTRESLRGFSSGVTRTATADEEAVAARDKGTRGRQWGLAS